MATARQISMSKGEVSPSMYARVDMAAYQTSLKRLRNCIVKKEGGAQNRGGTKFVGEAKASSTATRLIPYDDGANTYAVELGNLYSRFITNGGQVTRTGQNITAISNANPAVLTYSGSDTYANGDHVYVSGVVGPIAPYVNGRTFMVANVSTGSNTFELDYLDGTNVDSTSWGAYTSGGTIAEVYTVTTTYPTADLFELDYAQDGSEITIVHPTYPARKLTRSTATSWTIADRSFVPSVSVANVEYWKSYSATASVTSGGALEYRYKIAPIMKTGVEGFPCFEDDKTINAATQANPCAITTSTSHGYVTGDEVWIENVAGMTQLNDRFYRITRTGATTFTLNGVDSSAYTAYSSGGDCYRTSVGIGAAAAPSVSAPITLSITMPINPFGSTDEEEKFAVYKESGGVFGFIGYIVLPYQYTQLPFAATFKDTGIPADVQDCPLEVKDGILGDVVFASSGEYPSCVAYAEERLVLAAPTNFPKRVYLSETDDFNTFSERLIGNAKSTIEQEIATQKSSTIKFMAVLGQLLIFADRGEFVVNKSSDSGMTPSNFTVTQEGYIGCGSVKPISVGNSILFVDQAYSGVYDFDFVFESDGYQGNQISILSSHMFDGYTIVDAAVQKTPDPIAWFVRSDGQLLSCTYIREQQVFGWATHDLSGGTVESVCAVKEGEADALYMVVNRTIGGSTKRYIERMTDRFFLEEDVETCCFLDSALTYDGWNSGSTTQTVSLGTGWTTQDTQTMTASANFFSADDVGNEIWLRSGSSVIRFEILAYTSATVVTVRPSENVPVAFQATAFTDWARAVDTITGLWHLEGEDVSVFGDGNVVANALTDDTPLTVTNGSITLGTCVAYAHVGLPIISDIQTLDIDTPNAVIANKRKLPTKATLQVEKTRGLYVGASFPTGDDPVENLDAVKLRQFEGYNEPVDLLTGTCEVGISAGSSFGGSVVIRQVDPLPMTINGIMTSGYF